MPHRGIILVYRKMAESIIALMLESMRGTRQISGGQWRPYRTSLAYNLHIIPIKMIMSYFLHVTLTHAVAQLVGGEESKPSSFHKDAMIREPSFTRFAIHLVCGTNRVAQIKISMCRSMSRTSYLPSWTNSGSSLPMK